MSFPVRRRGLRPRHKRSVPLWLRRPGKPRRPLDLVAHRGPRPEPADAGQPLLGRGAAGLRLAHPGRLHAGADPHRLRHQQRRLRYGQGATAPARRSPSSTPTTIPPSSTAPTPVSAPATWRQFDKTFGIAQPAELHQVQRERPDVATCPAPTRPAPATSTATGRWRRPSTSSGRTPSPRGRASTWSRRATDTNNNDLFDGGEDRRRPARRLGGLDELGHPRVQRRSRASTRRSPRRPATRA